MLLSETVTTDPPLGAAPESVTVQVEAAPDTTVAGAQPRLLTVTAAGVTVTLAVFELPLSDAVTVTAWFAVTVPAVAVNVALVAPDATVTDAGAVSAVLLSETVTADPPLGAAPESVTVQVEAAPETTLAGAQPRLLTVTAAGVTVTLAVFELPLSDAVTVTAWFAVTVPAVAVNVALVAPDATVTDAGAVSAVLLSETVTTDPPLGAAPETVTVQIEAAPETTLAGAQPRLLTVTAAGVTVTLAVFELPLSDAVTVTAWFAVTVPAVAVNVALVAPDATVTDAGAVSAVLLSETVTTDPPPGAAPESVTVQVEAAPDTTDAGAQPRLLTVTAAGGTVTVTVAVFELPLSAAVTVTAWFPVTVPAVAVKVALAAPAATVTVPDAGNVSAALLSETVTTDPPPGAAPESVTVQVEAAPDTTDAGAHCSDCKVTAGDPLLSADVFMSVWISDADNARL